MSSLLGLLGIALQGLDVPVGLDCSPITVVGVGAGNQCSANTVCCQNNNVVSIHLVPFHLRTFNSRPRTLVQGGLISIGCVPAIL